MCAAVHGQDTSAEVMAAALTVRPAHVLRGSICWCATQLNFDMIDFSEIPQAIVDELRKTVETDTFAACAMMPKS